MGRLFKNLEIDELLEYKTWAREHYVVHSEIKGIWHPVVQIECVRMNCERNGFLWNPDDPEYLDLGPHGEGTDEL